MYLLAISVCLVVAYFILGLVYGQFFNNKFPEFSSKSLFSVAAIFLLSILGYIFVFNIPDPEFSNRVLHAYGGGFLATLVCFLALRDTQININKFQFFVITISTVTTLGVGNEILEFYLQNYAGFTFFSTTPNSTWHDLISNLIGNIIGIGTLICFVPSKSSQT
jgi:drug/metabolite transporter superfamily protein YnfA